MAKYTPKRKKLGAPIDKNEIELRAGDIYEFEYATFTKIIEIVDIAGPYIKMQYAGAKDCFQIDRAGAKELLAHIMRDHRSRGLGNYKISSPAPAHGDNQ